MDMAFLYAKNVVKKWKNMYLLRQISHKASAILRAHGLSDSVRYEWTCRRM